MSVGPTEVPGPCADCGRDEICADFEGRPLCQDDWHAARGRTQPYNAFRVKDGYCIDNGAYTKEEAEARAREATESDEQQLQFQIGYRDDPTNDAARTAWYSRNVEHILARRKEGWGVYEARPVARWWGERIAHPGYMAWRRASVLAAHPEYR